MLEQRSVPVVYPEAIRAAGDRFHYLRGQMPTKTTSGSDTTGSVPAAGANDALPTAGMQLEWTHFIGGSREEALVWLRMPVIDRHGLLWFVGTTKSPDFPTTPDAFDRTYHGGGRWGAEDVVVVAVDPHQPGIAYSTLLGGAKGPEHAAALCIDDRGRVIVVGNTGSSDYPTTNDALTGSFQGPDFRHADGFLAILGEGGRRLEYSTFIGGPENDGVNHVFLGPSGELTLFGTTESAAFLDAANDGSAMFAMRLDASARRVLSTHLWMNLRTTDVCRSASGDFLIVGTTNDAEFTTTEGAFDRTYNGGTAASGGDIFVLGKTTSRDLPTTADALEHTNAADASAFLVRFSGDGSRVLYSTYLGGKSAGVTSHTSCLLSDDRGRIHLGLSTTSPDLPVTPDAVQPKFQGGRDAFLLTLRTTDNTIDYGTYLGGEKDDGVRGLVCDERGALYAVGTTCSDDFPTGAASVSARRGQNIFISKFSVHPDPAASGPTPSSRKPE